MNYSRARKHREAMLAGAEYYRRLQLLAKKRTTHNAERARVAKYVAWILMRKAVS